MTKHLPRRICIQIPCTVTIQFPAAICPFVVNGAIYTQKEVYHPNINAYEYKCKRNLVARQTQPANRTASFYAGAIRLFPPLYISNEAGQQEIIHFDGLALNL